jgi:hypothetical protein
MVIDLYNWKSSNIAHIIRNRYSDKVGFLTPAIESI